MCVFRCDGSVRVLLGERTSKSVEKLGGSGVFRCWSLLLTHARDIRRFRTPFSAHDTFDTRAALVCMQLSSRSKIALLALHVLCVSYLFPILLQRKIHTCIFLLSVLSTLLALILFLLVSMISHRQGRLRDTVGDLFPVAQWDVDERLQSLLAHPSRKGQM